MPDHHNVLIIGGGTAGLSVAARLRAAGVSDVAIVEPSSKHYYQPLWTLVGAGVFPKEATEREGGAYIPPGATWIRDAALEFEPEANAVKLQSGARITYDQLVVCPGIQLDWGKIKGLDDNVGKDGICSNYRYDTVESTWRFIQGFTSGNAIFTFPPPPIKCAGAPQKIMYLADEAFRKQGVREKANIIYMAASPCIFGVKKYAATLNQVVARKGIDARYRQSLVEVRPAKREAIFRHLDTGEETVLPYSYGYASCPLVTGYGKLILAEFDYDGNPAESFPFDQSQERFSMYMLKAYGLPDMYWNGMLRGRA